MTVQKLKIDKRQFDINLIFYNFLKKVTQAKLTDKQINDLLEIHLSNQKLQIEDLRELMLDYVENNINRQDMSVIFDLLSELDVKNLPIFLFALKLNLVKDLLLQEAKIARSIKTHELAELHQLSLAYDRVSTQVAYSTRISGALLSLLFFDKLEAGETNFMSEDTGVFLKDLSKLCIKLSKRGLEPNQIFMLLFAESVNQSITSSAGSSYEDRIRNILIGMGIDKDSIYKTHDENDSSTEFDFFFTYKNKTYGISAKRTLRERYKQFIKTVQMSDIDIMLEITLGTDLRENIAKSIRSHGVYLFVADEVYESKKYLQEIDGVFRASQLSRELLSKLAQ